MKANAPAPTKATPMTTRTMPSSFNRVFISWAFQSRARSHRLYGREKAEPSDDCNGGDAVTKRSIRCRNQWTPGSLGLGVSPGRRPARCATGVGPTVLAHLFECLRDHRDSPHATARRP